MSNSLFAVTIDCADASAVAQFWAAALGRQVAEGSTPEHVVLLPDGPAAGGQRLVFNKVPEPKTVKNRVHLDLILRSADDVPKHTPGVGQDVRGQPERELGSVVDHA